MTPIEDEITAIRTASTRTEAVAIRNRVANEGVNGLRTKAEWAAACAAFIQRWGVDSVGGYPEAIPGDRYMGD